MRGILAAALLAASSAAAQQGTQQAQAAVRQTVSSVLPPDVRDKLPPGGDLRGVMEGLSPDAKRRAADSLADQEGQFKNDPVALAVVGQAYASLGDPARAGLVADRLLAQDPRNGDGLAIRGRALQAQGDLRGALAAYKSVPPGHPQATLAATWQRQIQQDLERQGGSVRPAGWDRPQGDSSGSGAGPDAGPLPAAFRQRLQAAIAERAQSPTLDSTLQAASPNGATLADLNAAGIYFKPAPAEQKSAVQLIENGGTFTVSIRADALAQPERAAAHFGDGVKRAVTDRDNSGIAWVAMTALGRITGARIHKELAPGDIDAHPANPSDRDLMLARKFNDLRGSPYNAGSEDYGTLANQFLPMFNVMAASGRDVVQLFQKFLNSTGEATPPPGRN